MGQLTDVRKPDVHFCYDFNLALEINMFKVFIFVYLVAILTKRPVATEDCSLNNLDVYIHYYTHEQSLNIAEEIKEIPVYKNCTDKETIQGCCRCLTDKILCTTVDRAVNVVETLSNVTSVFMGLLSNSSLNSSNIILLQNKQHVAIVGVQNNYSIECVQPTGFVFKSIEQIDIFNITWKYCGFKYEKFLGAVVFHNCYNISIVYSVFSENFGSAVIINYNVLDDSTSELGNLTTALWKSSHLVSVRIRNSSFTYNGKQLGMDTSVIYGGGILFHIYSILSPLNIEVSDTDFYYNNANFGGGVAVITNTFDNTSHQIVLMNSLFKQNTAYKDGGAFYQLGLFITTFTSCRFTLNSAQHFGGAATIVGQNTLAYFSEYFLITFERTYFVDNAAYRYAAIYLLIPFPVTNQRLEIRNSFIKNNYLYPDVYDTDNCIIYISRINSLISNSEFVSNLGSCICVDVANLYIDGDVMYDNNNGYRGAALNLKGKSKLFVNNYTNLTLSKNIAVYGGAIFKAGTQNSSSQCVFDFDDVVDYKVMFTSNTARFSGQSIFYVDPTVATECKEQIQNNRHVVLFPPDIQQIETTATKIMFFHPIEEIIDNGTIVYVMKASLGMYLSFNATVASTLSSDTSALVYVSLTENGNDFFNDTKLKLNGFTLLTLKTGETLTDLYFTGINIYEPNMNFSLVFSLPENYQVIATLKLQLLPCKFGFTYNDSLHRCDCVESKHILCNKRQDVACIQQGYWFGTLDDQFIVSPCFSGFCKNTPSSCESCILEDGISGFCKLQDSEDDECIDNRASIACVYCMDDYRYTYGAVMCAKKSECGGKDYAIIIIASVLFPIVFVVLLVALLKLDTSLNSAYLYCFIYYYSVIRFVLPPSLIHKNILIVASLLESFTQLNPIFLGEFNICFSLSSRSLYLVALNYFFPIAIGVFVLVVIFAAKCLPRLLKFSDNTPVRAICLLLLFSFTAIAETSFEIINPVRFSNHKESFVASDPKLEYLKKEHIWLWIIAMLFMIVFILPFTFLLTFSPLLMRCCNLTKIKPYLDQFHGVYKDEYRWMSGFYFIGRLVYYSVLVHPDINQLASVSILQYVGVIVALFHCIIQPYKSKFLNVADGILLGDIVFLSLLNEGTNRDIDADDVNLTKLRLAFTYILLVIPIGYILILVATLCLNKSKLLRNLLSRFKVKINNSWTCIKERFKKPQEATSSIRISTAIPTVDILQEREPLIRELGQVESVTVQKEMSEKPVVIAPRSKQTTFSELLGSGNMTPGNRRGSFLVHHTRYDDKEEGNNLEIHEVIADVN